MSKTFAATCSAGVVMVSGLALPGVVILGKGVGQSTGVAVFDDDRTYYIPKAEPDLETLIDKVVAIIDQAKAGLDKAVESVNKAAAALTQVDAKPTGGSGSAPTPVAGANITGITTASAAITTATGQLATIKTELNTFKGNLI